MPGAFLIVSMKKLIIVLVVLSFTSCGLIEYMINPSEYPKGTWGCEVECVEDADC